MSRVGGLRSNHPRGTVVIPAVVGLLTAAWSSALEGIAAVDWDELDVVEQFRSFLDAPERFLRHLLHE